MPLRKFDEICVEAPSKSLKCAEDSGNPGKGVQDFRSGSETFRVSTDEQHRA